MNDVILKNLRLLKDQSQAEKNKFKVKAYFNAISEITKFGQRITLENVKSLNLTPKMTDKVVEIINTGELEAVKNIDEKDKRMFDAVETLTKVMGIGPAKSRDLFQKHNIATIADLKEFAKTNPDHLTDMQKIGLEYLEDINTRIPYKEMEKHDVYLGKILDKYKTYEIVGSYRRKEKTSGDIDVLVCVDDEDSQENDSILREIIKNMMDSGYIKAQVALGQKKFMGICKLPRHKTNRRLDVIVVHKSYYPFMVLYFTGSDQFNVNMRIHALSKGYSLNEYGLTATTDDAKNKLQNISFQTEQDIFNFLDYPYVNPEKRSAKS